MRLPAEFSIPVQPLQPQIITRNLLLSQSRPQLFDLLAEAVDWAQNSGLNPNDEFRYEQEYEYLTLARVLIAQNKAEQATPLLDRLISSAQGAGRNSQLITYLSLQAIAHHNLDNADKALKTLSRALALGEPQGYVRTFVDLGPPMQDLLRIATGQRIAPGYVGKLLAAFPTKAVKPAQQEIKELVEPLNERETTILHYMDARLSNQEIANQLYLSVNTVKWYARNIYGKLGVGNRRAVVVKARELGIL